MYLIKYKSIIFSIILVITLMLSGCTEEKEVINDDKTNDDPVDFDYENIILGTWYKNQSLGNITFIIEYKFFSNQSFFSGIRKEESAIYNESVWGDYVINNETIKFIVGGEIPSESTLKYLLSPEGEFLLLYFENEIDYDVLKRKL